MKIKVSMENGKYVYDGANRELVKHKNHFTRDEAMIPIKKKKRAKYKKD